jgi:hypothetical protein
MNRQLSDLLRAFRTYLGVVVLGNLAWEALQLPLYTRTSEPHTRTSEPHTRTSEPPADDQRQPSADSPTSIQ